MSWAGMRGVVSLAAALALPEQFPGRDFILTTTFAVILVTVLVQGATLAPLILALRLGSFAVTQTTTLSEAAARARIASVQLTAVEAQSKTPDGNERHPRLLEHMTTVPVRPAATAKQRTVCWSTEMSISPSSWTQLPPDWAELLRLHRAGEIHAWCYKPWSSSWTWKK